MPVHRSVIIDGKEYMWDGQVFRDANEAKREARRYLRQGFEVHMKNENGQFYIYRNRGFSCKRCSLQARA